jgi:translin
MGWLDIDGVRRYLEDLEEAREQLIKVAREVSQLARAVVSSSIRRREDARRYRRELSERFRYLLEISSKHPELAYSNLFYSIAAEYVEAMQLYSVVFDGKLLTLNELNVHPVPYLLGHADLIGELKRLSLEHLRRGEYDESFSYLELAEGIYEELSSTDTADPVVPGLRRKLDVYRKVIDDWKVLLIDIESRVKLEKVCGEVLKGGTNAS